MTEDALHKAIFRYLKAVLPHGWDVLHIPNNPRSAVAGARLKAMGMMKGAPDIMILGNEARVYFLEVKTPKGRASSEQRKVHDRLMDKGFPVAVVRSIDDVRDFIAMHGLPSRDLGTWEHISSPVSRVMAGLAQSFKDAAE
jgi:hypothetical protein